MTTDPATLARYYDALADRTTRPATAAAARAIADAFRAQAAIAARNESAKAVRS